MQSMITSEVCLADSRLFTTCPPRYLETTFLLLDKCCFETGCLARGSLPCHLPAKYSAASAAKSPLCAVVQHLQLPSYLALRCSSAAARPSRSAASLAAARSSRDPLSRELPVAAASASNAARSNPSSSATLVRIFFFCTAHSCSGLQRRPYLQQSQDRLHLLAPWLCTLCRAQRRVQTCKDAHGACSHLLHNFLVQQAV